jgi:uncharacterized protein YjbI with pentapeptide repeats
VVLNYVSLVLLTQLNEELTVKIYNLNGELIHDGPLRPDLILREASLDHCDLAYTDLRGVDFTGASLHGADMAGVNAIYANFSGADLSDADLSDASLRGTNFYGADMSEACIVRAHMVRANITGVNLQGANLRDMLGDGARIRTHTIEGYIINIYDDRIQIGCENRSRKAWELMSAIDILKLTKNNCDAKLWAKYKDKVLSL